MVAGAAFHAHLLPFGSETRGYWGAAGDESSSTPPATRSSFSSSSAPSARFSAMGGPPLAAARRPLAARARALRAEEIRGLLCLGEARERSLSATRKKLELSRRDQRDMRHELRDAKLLKASLDSAKAKLSELNQELMVERKARMVEADTIKDLQRRSGARIQIVAVQAEAAGPSPRRLDHGQCRVRHVDADTVTPDDGDIAFRFVHYDASSIGPMAVS